MNILATFPPVGVAPPLELNGDPDTIAYLVEIEASVQRRLDHLLSVERLGTRGIELELAICADDFLYWLHWYGWTYDPRNPLENPPLPSTLPFDLCPRQVEMYEWMEQMLSLRKDGCIKKSRGIGFTWEVGALALHKWLFVPGFKTTFGSRKATEVDQIGSPDGFFEKLRLMYGALPHWMMPRGFLPYEHDKQCLLVNPANNNTIRGEIGDQMGRGGRSTLYIIDEAAQIQRADRVDAATSANSNVRFWGSTINPQNENNLFQRKYSAFPADRVFRFHYSEHPIWTAARIANKKADVSPEIWATEFEIDDSYIAEDICIPAAWVQSATKLFELCMQRYLQGGEDRYKFKIEPRIEGVAGGDVGGGKAMSVIIARFGPIICRPKAWSDPDTTDTALKMLDYCAETRLPPREDNYQPRIKYLRYDSVAIGQGVASTMKRNPRPNLVTTGVNVGNPASDVRWPDGERAHEKFHNTKAEGWWTARERFKKTYEMVLWMADPNQPGAKCHPVDELAALPDDPRDVHLAKLITQLSQVKWFRRENGKIIMESKEQLAKRGVSSPDYADAYVLTETGMGKAEKLAAFAQVLI